MIESYCARLQSELCPLSYKAMDVLSVLFSAPALIGTLFFLCLGYLYYTCVYKPIQFYKQAGIPGPKPKPFIGNLDLLLKLKGDTLAVNRHMMSQYGPISCVFLGNKPSYFISDVDLCKEITVKHFDKFVDRFTQHGLLVTHMDGKTYDGMFASSGDEWRKRRRAITPAFSAHKMKLMEPLIKESTLRLAGKIQTSAENEETVDALEMYNKMTMEVILSTAFGRAVDVQGGNGGKLFESAMAVFSAFSPGENERFNVMRVLQFSLFSFPILESLIHWILRSLKAGKAMDFMSQSAAKIIDARRKNSEQNAQHKDLLQLMIDASDSETQKGLETGEIVAESVGFFLAGYETTSTTLTFATFLLAANPEVQERLVNEIHEYLEENPDKSMYDASHDHELQYLDMVVQETLRMYPAATVTFRICNEDCVLNGVPFRKGSFVFLPIRTVHYDPNVWMNPEEFNPDRFTPEEKAKHHPCAYLPFGYGPRNCVGMRFALLEVKMALIEIVSKFKIVLAPETRIPLEVATAFTLKPKHGIFVKFEPRNWSI